MKTTSPTFYQKVEQRFQAEKKNLQKKRFRLKARVILTVILPVFILLLAVKVTKTFVGIKVHSLFTRPYHMDEPVSAPTAVTVPPASLAPVAAHMEPVTLEIVTPEPAGQAVGETVGRHV